MRDTVTRTATRAATRAAARRTVLGAVCLAVLVLGGGPTATGMRATAGGLSLEVPATAVEIPPEQVGHGWQWCARSGTARSPALLVCMRSDLASDVEDEILGAVLASAGAGHVPNLRLSGRRTLGEPSRTPQTRVSLAYGLAGSQLHGLLLVAPRSGGFSGLVAVVGDDRLTAGVADAILDTVTWVS